MIALNRLSDYEINRQNTIKKNSEMMAILGLRQVANELSAEFTQLSKSKSPNKTHTQEDINNISESDSDYKPSDSDDINN